MKVKPSRPDLVIRFPKNPTRVLKAEGEDVPDSAYWLRRLADGERGMDGIVLVPDPVTPLTTR